jgi:cytochrome c-type biogenesis protein CcmH/NrfG
LVADEGHSADSWRVFLQLGRFYCKQQNFVEAVKALVRASELKPDDANVQLVLGRAYLGVDQGTRAIHAFKEACKLDPDMAAARLQLAKAAMGQGDFSEAHSVLNELANGNKALVAVHRLLGDLAVEETRYRQAVEEYQAAVLHGKNLAEQHPELLALEAAGRDDEAKALAYQAAFAAISAAAEDASEA